MPVCHKILLALLLGLPLKVYPQSDRPLPNIIVVFIDDMGFGDVSIHQPSIDYTPNFQYLADHGVVMNHFYVSESVCTASRSSLLTGCYANRVGMGGAIDHSSQFGLNPEETTMAEMLRSRGYKTAAIGKWHLGFQQPFLPTSQGFDEFFGIPYSNDMWPHHPQTPGYYPPLPLYKNETVIDTVREQSWFTQTFTDKAIDFIRRGQDQPFFLYLAHPLPHVPLFVSKTYRGSTGKGLYADVIHEIDATIGQLLEALRTQRLEENTLLIVTSDNGPWLAYGNHAGSTAGLREGKGTSWEGGVRVPFVAYWKGVLPQNVRVNQEAMTIDLLPTLAHLTGADLPQRKTDGVNLWPVLSGEQEKLPDRPLFFYYNRNDLEAMRWKQWKLYFPHAYRTMEGQPQGLDGQPGQYRNVRMGAPELYDLLTDPSEQSNVVRNYAAIADTMQQMAEAMRLELGDDLRGMAGRENRSAGIFRDSPHPPIPFWDATLPFEKRADDVLTRLSLDEKVQQLMHRAPEIKRLGIPAYNWWNEALHGVARTKYTTTVFPQAIGMAATWDTSAMLQAGRIVATEGRAIFQATQREGKSGHPYTGLTYWSPNINIFRDPRWGRGQETYGEDPLLTASMASAYVEGIQGNHPRYLTAAACAKHFAVHSGPEPTRHSFDARPSQYDLWDTYLPAFETLVRHARVQGVMCAYNAFQGQPCCASDVLMQEILRKKWGFTGYVTSDCWGLNDFIDFHKSHADKTGAAVDALIHSTDVECGQDIFLKLADAVRAGLIAESSVDTALHRLFLLRLRLGMFDPASRQPWTTLDTSVLNKATHQSHALEMARKSIVLLKNENHTLPISKELRKVVVCGPNADNRISILGNYTGLPKDPVTLVEGVRRKVGTSCQVIHDQAVGFTNDTIVKYGSLAGIWGQQRDLPGILVSYYDNDRLEGQPVATSRVDEIDEYWLEGQAPAKDVPNFYYSCRYTAYLEASADTTIQFELDGDDGYRLFVSDSLWVDGWRQRRGGPVYFSLDVRKGKPVRVVLEHRQTEGPASIRLRSCRKVVYDFAEWIHRHGDADMFVFAGGISPQLEGEELKVHHEGFEGGDRTTITLPQVQKKFLRALHDAGKKVVFVMMTGSAIAIPEEEAEIPAILNAWYGGQSAGTAIADVLFGDYNPAGRLPVTFYRSDKDLPPFTDYSMEGRTYRYFQGDALYPFGYGLSYTKFTYSDIQFQELSVYGDSLLVTANVKNTGHIAGDEVVQCYLQRNEKRQKSPISSLKGFKRIFLLPGEAKNVSFTLNKKDLSLIDSQGNMVWVPGKISVSIGGGQPREEFKRKNHFTEVNILLR